MHCVDLGESFPMHIFLQNLASIQPRTSSVKFACSPRTDPPGWWRTRQTSRPPTSTAASRPTGRESLCSAWNIDFLGLFLARIGWVSDFEMLEQEDLVDLWTICYSSRNHIVLKPRKDRSKLPGWHPDKACVDMFFCSGECQFHRGNF